MTLRLTNTLTRTLEPFVPRVPGQVSIYCCGVTVYDLCHLGHARSYINWDVLRRYLLWRGYAVTYVQNFTDIDDKILRTAAAEGSSMEVVSERNIAAYFQDMDALQILRPDRMPRATRCLDGIRTLIGELESRGAAYSVDGDVYFSVRSRADYGKLSGRSLEQQQEGASGRTREEEEGRKQHPFDFALWKGARPGEPSFPSPWGPGRPGWHIECSAMSLALLGASFDIHGGGIDLQFPHHENEVAQSCCAHPEAEFARVWMHNEMLQVEGKKMSKSLGNFFTVRDLLDQGYPGEVIRMVFLGTHYGRPMDWTAEKAGQAEATLRKWRGMVAGVAPSVPSGAVVAALADDLNTAGAIAELHALAASGDVAGLKASAGLMGLLEDHMGGWVEAGVDLAPYAARLASLREAAMQTKDFAPVDAMKAALLAAGAEVRMSKAGVEVLPGPGFDAAKLEGLV